MNLTCQALFDNQEQCSPVVANLGLLCYPAAAIKSLRFALFPHYVLTFRVFRIRGYFGNASVLIRCLSPWWSHSTLLKGSCTKYEEHLSINLTKSHKHKLVWSDVTYWRIQWNLTGAIAAMLQVPCSIAVVVPVKFHDDLMDHFK